MIYHITTKTLFNLAQALGEYKAESLTSEGFIHCSTAKQVAPVANAFYKGQHGLILLQIDENKIESQVKWEAPAGPPADGISESDLFPHIYGPINLDAIASVLDFEPDSTTGNFSFTDN